MVETIKRGSKYYPLYEFLTESEKDTVSLSLQQIEELLGSDLPASAMATKGYWSNRSRGGLQAKAWLGAGFHVVLADLGKGEITFQKLIHRYTVRKKGDTILWDGGMVRALRAYLGMSQVEMAAIIGIRQQTISEWENEVYLPTRGRSNHLTMVAERAGFYIADESDADPVAEGNIG